MATDASFEQEASRPQEEVQDPSKRRFLKRASVAAGAAASYLLFKGSRSKSGESFLDKVKNLNSEKTPKYSELTTETGIKVFLDREGLPVIAIVPGRAEPIRFDYDEVRKKRESALKGNEPEILDVARIKPNYSSVDLEDISIASRHHETDPDLHPTKKELPTDTISESELEQKGINIIQASRTKLSIRKGAFEQTEPLAAFDNTGRKMTIVLLDTPYISPFGVKDAKYDSVRNLIPKDERNPNRVREEQKSLLQKYLDKTRKDTKNDTGVIKINSGQVNPNLPGTDLDIFRSKREMLIVNSLSDDELLFKTQTSVTGIPQEGKYFAPSDNGDAAVIFIPASDDYREINFATFYFTSEGKFKVEDSGTLDKITTTPGFAPRKEHAYPNPSDFSKADVDPSDPTAYPYGSQTIGQCLRHEFLHDLLIKQNKEKSNWSEYDTDMSAMEGIRKAWQKWVDSNYTDDSGFYLAFSLSNGEYVLT